MAAMHVVTLHRLMVVAPVRLMTAVARVRLLRADCVRELQALEASLHLPRPFYESRPAHSTAAVEAFLADLDNLFVAEWTTANSESAA